MDTIKIIGEPFIEPKEIELLMDCTADVAIQSYQIVLETLSPKANQVTIEQYCKFYDLEPTGVVIFLNQHREL